MAGVTVGGMPILVSPGSISRPRDDGADRRRAFDNTYRVSQVGGAARDFVFSTPPVLRATADIYEAQLSIFASQMCSGDVIAIPTMCCAEITGWHPVRLAVGHGVIIDFVLHEQQSAKLLLKYAPGDTIPGESFTRASTGYQINSTGVLVAVGNDVKRDSHYIGGVRSLLLEDTRTNQLLRSIDFSHAAWVKSASMAVATGIADPAASTGACTLTASASTQTATQTLSAGSSIVRTNSIWMRRRTGTGTIALSDPINSTNATPALTGTWTKYSISGAAGTARIMVITIFTSGDEIDVWDGDLEDGAFASSEILTVAAAASRAVETYSLPYTATPGEGTFYAKFVEKGTLQVTGRVVHIGNAADASPHFLIYSDGSHYVGFHSTTLGAVASTLTGTAPVIGDVVELMARLYGDGSVDITQTINGGTATTATRSAALAFATTGAWSGQLCYLNSAGTTGAYGFTALQSLKIVAGSRSLTEMRVL